VDFKKAVHFKLGKGPVKQDARTLKLARYICNFPPLPASCSWLTNVSNFGMMRNSDLGDCTCAAAGHMIEIWTANETQQEFIVPDPDIVTAYSAVSGYDPATGANDNGAVIVDVLNYWRGTGIGGHKITAYASIDPRNHMLIKQAICLFGAVDLGIQLPLSAQNQVGQTWEVPSEGLVGDGAPGSWGGHSVPVAAFGPDGITCITWGELQVMSWGFFQAYCDEAYAVFSEEWIAKDAKNPGGVDTALLQADLNKL
jgi:hypothetical protein